MPKKEIVSEGYFKKKKVDDLKNSGKKQIKTKYVFIIFFIVLAFTFLATYLVVSGDNFEPIPTCGDGTFYNSCSLTKPYFCEEGVLTEKASLCGCRELGSNIRFEKEGEFCISEYNINSIDIPLSYILNGEKNSFNFTVYEGVKEHVFNLSRELSFEGSEIPFRASFKQLSINDEVQRNNLLPLVKKIQNFSPDNKVNQARIAVSVVQNIPYGHSEEKSFFGDLELNHSRYPYEVLFDNQGICGEKSILMAFLLKEIGYGVAIFYFQEENHEAVGIKCPSERSLYGTGYCFVETGGPSIITDHSMEFVGGTTLESIPEVLIISEGISLPDRMQEYEDAITIRDIRERNIFGLVKFWKYNSLKEKYHLEEVYELR